MPNNNITQFQILRGTSGSNAAYVGRAGELTADMETTVAIGTGIVRLHDGETPGGFIIGKIGGGGTSSSGTSGVNGQPGPMGLPGAQGATGSSGTSGTSGLSGTSGSSGRDGVMGLPGVKGDTGSGGSSGTSGTSGTAGSSGTSGSSGRDGVMGLPGLQGPQGDSGSSGTSGLTGSSGTAGSSGTSGSSGRDGVMGLPGLSGADGSSGSSGSSGTSGVSGSSGSSGSSGTSGATGSSGSSGSSGRDGVMGLPGIQGSSGTSGATGASGTSGSSGTSGATGASGTSGSSGSSGTSGATGASGTSGSSGSSGTSGANGATGSSGSSGTSGTGFTTISNAADNRVLTSTGAANAANAEANLTFDGSVLTMLGSYFSVNNQGYIRGDSSGYLVLQGGSTATNFNNSSNAATLMTILNGGNVGIGTTSPNYKLHILGSGAFTGVYVKNNDTSGTFNRSSIAAESDVIGMAMTAWGTASARAGTAWFQTYTNHPVVIGVNDNEVMRLTTSGNVGIGTTSPIAKLHVQGSAVYLSTTDDYASGTTGSGLIVARGAATGNTYSQIYGVQAGGTSYANLVVPGGNVGIGTTSPTNARLVVRGIGTTSATAGFEVANINGNTTFFVQDNGTSRFFGSSLSEIVRINHDGNVGIGTTSPTVHSSTNSALVVRGAGTSRGIIEVWDGGGTGKAVFQQVGSTTYVGNLAGNGDLVLLTNGTGTSASETMTLKASGNVGIGTTSPSEKLHVIGNILASANITAYSDARIKKNVMTLQNALHKVMQLRGVSYTRIDNDENNIGVIAQEVLEVLPEVVLGSEETQYSVSYGNITALLIEAIKELKKEIDVLKENQ